MLESKKRAAIFLILAFLLALVAGYFVLDKVKTLNAELGGTTEIYVAKEGISARQPIDESKLTTEEIPNKFFKKGWHIEVKDKDKIVGKAPVVSIASGEIITANILRDLSTAMDENNRLISVFPTEKVSFDQEVEPLDRVDIIVSSNDSGAEKTEFLMRDVLVYYAQKNESGGGMLGAALEVSLQDSTKLIHAQHYADKVRILKANVGKESQTPAPVAAPSNGAKVEQQPTNPTEKPVEAQQPAAEKPAAEQQTTPKENTKQNNE